MTPAAVCIIISLMPPLRILRMVSICGSWTLLGGCLGDSTFFECLEFGVIIMDVSIVKTAQSRRVELDRFKQGRPVAGETIDLGLGAEQDGGGGGISEVFACE
jgi:hypothetical protein